jgi:hypothetical protein
METITAFKTESGLVTDNHKEAMEDERKYRMRRILQKCVGIELVQTFFLELEKVYNDGAMSEKNQIVEFAKAHKGITAKDLIESIEAGKHKTR